LQRYTAVALTHGKERGADQNSAQLLAASEGTFRIGLDERGRELTTGGLVELINRWELEGSIKTVGLLIGGADGHTEGLRSGCQALWRLSSLTLQHELALLVLLEALYRAYTIKRGEPYHR
jgi:23S rRNA (pseudouridine1915-N3)-methyltransferase